MGHEADTEDLEAFQSYLRETLTHLYDPTYQPSGLVWTVTGCDPQQGVESVWGTIVQAIEELKPAPDVPSNARIRRIYELLLCRYVQGLTQEEAAERLGITPRHLRREQQQAINVLAQRLWEHSRAETALTDDHVGEREMQSPESADSIAWRSQVQQELAVLQQSAPGMVADVGEAIRGVVALGSALTRRHDVRLDVGAVQSNLAVAIHPSALRQILVTAVEKLVQHMSSGQVSLYAERNADWVLITITGYPATVETPPDSDLIREILATQGGAVEVTMEDHHISFCVTLRCADEITVLVVDDNADLVHFYGRYITGTRYQVVHVAEGQRVFEMIEAATPDIIVLDVMLPDIDGWELLTRLHEHPIARSIPVIVCSVVRQEELALSLGAALYVRKPVRRRQFIQALDRGLNQASTKSLTAPASNAVAC